MKARAQEGDEGAMSRKIYSYGSLTALIAAAALSCGTAQAEPLFTFLAPPTQSQIAPQYEAAPAEQNDADENVQLDPRLQRQVVRVWNSWRTSSSGRGSSTGCTVRFTESSPANLSVSSTIAQPACDGQ
jgi:hypothetical protein